jgi:NADH:ubiquinone oxidoreductase subunit E
MAKYKMHMLVCGGTGCRASASEMLHENLKKEVQENGLENDVQVVTTGCFGFCEKGPIVKVIPDNTFMCLLSLKMQKTSLPSMPLKVAKLNVFFMLTR